MVTIEKVFSFSAAHRLYETVPKNHPCSRVHGHTYRGELSISGSDYFVYGMLIDFSKVKEILDQVNEAFDHKILLNCRDPLVKTYPKARVIFQHDPTVEHMTYVITMYVIFCLRREMRSFEFCELKSVSLKLFETENSRGIYTSDKPSEVSENIIQSILDKVEID